MRNDGPALHILIHVRHPLCCRPSHLSEVSGTVQTIHAEAARIENAADGPADDAPPVVAAEGGPKRRKKA